MMHIIDGRHHIDITKITASYDSGGRNSEYSTACATINSSDRRGGGWNQYIGTRK